MKLTQTPRKTTLIWSILIIILGLISGFTVWQLTDREELINQPETSPKIEQSSARNEPSQTMITLLEAEPIVAPSGDYTQDNSLWRLVNKTRPLSDLNYRPELAKPNVNTRQDKSLDEQSVRQDIVPAVEELFVAAKDAGHDLEIGSGFRSAELQNTYHTNYARVYGQAAADAISAKPGYSEHQTGLAIDISTTDRICYLEGCFSETPAGAWLRDNAHLYGFILRYPEGKEGIIDFNYEPWHFRYVGKDLAGALKSSGLTLDEAEPYLAKAQSKD